MWGGGCCECSPDVNFEELARCTEDFNGAQCKAVCVEAVSPPSGLCLQRRRPCSDTLCDGGGWGMRRA